MALGLGTFGQACGPSFQILDKAAHESASSTTQLSPEDRAACAPRSPLLEPTDLTSFVEYLNALPRPVKLSCIVMNLGGPIELIATHSQRSAQPALSARNPRIFIRRGELLIGIVPSGSSSTLVELGQLLPNSSQSLKAEFILPIQSEQISEADGVEHTRLSATGGTSCGTCHANETQVTLPNGARAFRSDILRFAAQEEVPLAQIEYEAQECARQNLRDERCLVYRALLSSGGIQRQGY